MKSAARHCWSALVAWAVLLCVPSVQSAVVQSDRAELAAALKGQPPCCVIDARSEAARRKHPLPEALPYRRGLTIIPTAPVVVVADAERNALKVARALAKQHPGKAIYAVKGGAAAWESVLQSLQTASFSRASGAADGGISFVIPHNTCETGTPLQVLHSKPKLQR